MVIKTNRIDLTKRRLLAVPLASAAMYLSNGVFATETCKITPFTEDGPLYPPDPFPWASDLTRVSGKTGIATGQPLYIYGQVLNHLCRPVSGAIVEIWQADNNGFYKHPRAVAPGAIDPFWEIRSDELDPFFKYFSRVKTDKDGRYLLKTIVPRWYRVFNINRAAHIHFKVRSLNDGVLTTEMYFPGDEQAELQAHDRVFQSRYNRSDLVVSVKQSVSDQGLKIPKESGALYTEFKFVFA